MTEESPFIPPILRNTQFVGILLGKGVQTMLFMTQDPDVKSGFIRVNVRFLGGPPVYDYSKWDPTTNTLIHYEGTHGDPSLDEGEITSTP